MRKVYDLAFQLSCKGVTIYRDGSKENQVLSFGQKKEEAERLMGAVLDRPETLFGFTTKIKTGYGHLYVTVTEFEGKPFEVFATIGKSGRSTTAKTEAIGRLVSLALRAGVTVDKIVDQLKGIGGEHPIFQDGGLVLSIPDAIARVLEKRYLIGENASRYRKTEHSLLGEKVPGVRAGGELRGRVHDLPLLRLQQMRLIGCAEGPIPALRGIPRSLRRTKRTPRAAEFTRLGLGP